MEALHVLIAPIRPWMLGPWADPQRAPWAPKASGPGPFGDRGAVDLANRRRPVWGGRVE